jgi:NADP-dependent 3-hydroxy acid dehydrogenase YdfG
MKGDEMAGRGFEAKMVVITGGGIGKATAARFLDEGASLVLTTPGRAALGESVLLL